MCVYAEVWYFVWEQCKNRDILSSVQSIPSQGVFRSSQTESRWKASMIDYICCHWGFFFWELRWLLYSCSIDKGLFTWVWVQLTYSTCVYIYTHVDQRWVLLTILGSVHLWFGLHDYPYQRGFLEFHEGGHGIRMGMYGSYQVLHLHLRERNFSGMQILWRWCNSLQWNMRVVHSCSGIITSKVSRAAWLLPLQVWSGIFDGICPL